MAKDPVCRARVTEGHAAGRSEYQGRLYCFCSLACQGQFEADPQRPVSQPAGGVEDA
jgi:YHS domain-containing protein